MLARVCGEVVLVRKSALIHRGPFGVYYYTPLALVSVYLWVMGLVLILVGLAPGYAFLILVGGGVAAAGCPLAVLDIEQEAAKREGRIGPVDRLRAFLVARRPPPW